MRAWGETTAGRGESFLSLHCSARKGRPEEEDKPRDGGRKGDEP